MYLNGYDYFCYRNKLIELLSIGVKFSAKQPIAIVLVCKFRFRSCGRTKSKMSSIQTNLNLQVIKIKFIHSLLTWHALYDMLSYLSSLFETNMTRNSI